MLDKSNLSDNADKPVYYWQKFAPPTKKKWNPEEQERETSAENYIGTEIFRSSQKERMCVLAVYKTILVVDFYYTPNYPHGQILHLDWNDSDILKVLGQTGEKRGILEIASLLNELGYTHSSSQQSETQTQSPTIQQPTPSRPQTKLF